MDLGTVIAELEREAERTTRAIAALVGLNKTAAKKRIAAPRGVISKLKKRGGITPAGRRRLSMLMKKRWAVRRKKGS